MSFIGNKPAFPANAGGVMTPGRMALQKQAGLSVAPDPLFGKVTLLLQHTSAERGVCDKSLYKRPPVYNNMTSTGTSQLVPINTAYAPAWAGMKSLYFANGGNHHVDFADSPDWTPNGDFTFEVVYWTTNASGTMVNHGGRAGDKWNAWGVTGTQDSVGWSASTGAYTTAYTYGNAGYTNSTASGTTHHTVLQRSGNTYSVGLDGTFTFSETNTNSPYNSDLLLTIGCDSSASSMWLGEIYAVRLTNAARYTGSTFPNAVTNGPFPTR